jgi:hypothetical protein
MSAPRRRLALLILGALAAGGSCLPSSGKACDQILASGELPEGEDGDCGPTPSTQDKARQAVEAGLVAPLDEALRAFTRGWPGEVLRIELEQHGKTLVYEAKILDPSGRRREVVLDAKTLATISEE